MIEIRCFEDCIYQENGECTNLDVEISGGICESQTQERRSAVMLNRSELKKLALWEKAFGKSPGRVQVL
jgi:hypothetical protein